jgi:hypothetical protein
VTVFLRLTVLTISASLTLAGCAQSSNRPQADRSERSSTPAAPVGSDAVEWVGSFCKTVGILVRSVYDAAPAVNSTALKTEFTHQLGTAAQALRDTATKLKDLPEAPIADGDRVVDDLIAKFTSQVDVFERAHDAMAALPDDADNRAVGEVMATASPTMAALTARPLKDVAVSQDFKTAGSRSP